MSIMPQIQHIIYLMLENRSFDNLLGWLYDDLNPPKHNLGYPLLAQSKFRGLKENKYQLTLSKGPYAGEHYVKKGVAHNDIPCDTPATDPGETYHHVNYQLFEQYDTPADGAPLTNQGFLEDFYNTHDDIFDHWPTDAGVLEILSTYTPDELPVINTLAKYFAVSDMWFASIPSQTNCNRAFAACGTSLGMVDNNWLKGYHPTPFDTPTIWNVLSENGYDSPADWKIYYWDVWPPGTGKTCFTYQLLPQLQQIPQMIGPPDVAANHIQPFSQFYKDLANQNLPRFSFLEPKWTLEEDTIGIWGNDYHPPSHVIDGEDLLRALYMALLAPANKEVWEKTLLVITFDEHGGCYDHVRPAWGAIPPTSTFEPLAEHGFQFNRYGVRVPTLLISPYIEEQTVFRSEDALIPYDHSSFLATLLKWFDIDQSKWGLFDRVQAAPTFEGVLTRTSPRTDIPILPNNWCDHFATEAARPFRKTTAAHVAQLLAAYHNVPDRAPLILRDIHAKCITQRDLADYFVRVKERYL